MAANASRMDYTCPVCCDIFTDPVLLLCGHSFCKHCLQQWWRQSGLQTCPVCKEIFPMAQPPRNLALRNLSDSVKRANSQRGSKEICRLHGEKLKLFCQEDQQLICLICRDAQKHKKHNFVPISEAVGTYRAELKLKMTHLIRKKLSFKAQKRKCYTMAGHIKFQAGQTEKTIKEDFQKLYQFLRAEEAARIDAVKKEEVRKSQAMGIWIANLTAEISSLKDKIKAMEKEMKAEDISFMLNIKSTLERPQCEIPDPEIPSGALIDEAKHLGNLLFTVWKNMKDIVQYTPVTLDPNTGDSFLTISEHMTRSTRSDNYLSFPANPERMDNSDVLGSEGFSSGKHSWDVAVAKYWSVGVAAKGEVYKKIWCIFSFIDKVRELTPQGHGKFVSKDSFPQNIRVQLDYDQGILSFLDLDRKTPIHTIKCTFTETVFPYFCGNAKILLAELSVSILHH